MTGLYDKHMDDKHTSSIPELYVRRTISISPKINKWIQDFRAKLMQDNPNEEYDYTTMANYLMAYGMVFIQKYTVDDDDHIEVNNLVGDRLLLEQESVSDMWENLHRKRSTIDAELKPDDAQRREGAVRTGE